MPAPLLLADHRGLLSLAVRRLGLNDPRCMLVFPPQASASRFGLSLFGDEISTAKSVESELATEDPREADTEDLHITKRLV